jgi:branched-chain amino acid transport system ATP-binding protein
VSEMILEVADLCKRFGALRVTDHVSLAVRRGEVHALIGPNGAGKTTLMGQLTGELAADSGSIRFQGRDISRLSTAQRARLGIARTFQITSIFNSFSAAGNVALAVQATAPHSFKFWRPADRIEALQSPADALLEDVGLADRHDTLAAGMSHGEHRQLELAMALATRPTLLLLDEPMAGLGTDESAAMTILLQRLKRDHTILLVEHDMDVVFALADRISVLVYGSVIASGTPAEIRNDPEVRAAYLGDDEIDFGEPGDA